MLKQLKAITNPFSSILLGFVLIVSSVFPKLAFSQQTEKPKVALVLSGGGAKGVAHIPLLQTLDSLNIRPDLLIGTSIGSVVGGLYAMGYSGDSIATIARNANWDQLLGGKISLQNVSVEEKSEFNKYLVELEYEEGSINPIPYIVNDQSLREFMLELTYPTYQIENFDELQIPFRSIATDIITGKEIILKDGSLAEAMRASMSLPAVFSPVEYKETLLVDGGVLNNYPVDIALEMGADFVIGSDVGDDIPKKENIKSITDVLFQASMLNSHQKREANRKNTDILIDHSETLQHGTGDFGQTEAIYQSGIEATAKKLEDLSKFSKKIQQYEQRDIELLTSTNTFFLDTVIYNGLSKNNLALIQTRTDFKIGEQQNLKEIKEALHKALGTTIFSSISFVPIVEGNHLTLKLDVIEKPVHQIKGALHYDRYRGIGLLANYTGRNVIGNGSRSLISLDIAEQPKLKLQHQKNFSNTQNWWWRSEVVAQQVNQNVYINGNNVNKTRNRYLEIDNQLNKNLQSFKNAVGFGFSYSLSDIKPTISPAYSNPSRPLIEDYQYSQTKLYAHYLYNTFNKVYFADTGSFLKGEIGHIIHNNVTADIYQNPATNIDEAMPNFTKGNFTVEKRNKMNKYLTTVLTANGGFIFGNRNEDDELLMSNYGVGAKYLLGGNIDDVRQSNLVFSGLKEAELAVTQYVNLGLATQFNFSNRMYIIPHANVANVGFGEFANYVEDLLSANGDWDLADEPSYLFSTGATVSYNSLLGPINLDVSYVNQIDKFRFFFSAGFPMHRSN